MPAAAATAFKCRRFKGRHCRVLQPLMFSSDHLRFVFQLIDQLAHVFHFDARRSLWWWRDTQLRHMRPDRDRQLLGRERIQTAFSSPS